MFQNLHLTKTATNMLKPMWNGPGRDYNFEPWIVTISYLTEKQPQVAQDKRTLIAYIGCNL